MTHIQNTQPTNRPSIAVVAICCNEEQDLPGFLDALIDWVDEIIIVDDGSIDSSEQIIRKAGPQVQFIQHRRTAETGFAGQRNRGIEAATCDWILNMDIDERPSYELREEILKSINDSTYAAYRYPRLNYFLHRPMKAGGWNSWNNPQLALRTAHHYDGRIHERAVIDQSAGKIGQLSSYMLHFNDDSYSERMRKSVQYCQLEADKLLEKNSTVRSIDFFVNPLFEFVKKYIIKRGFIDGVPGIISALHAACARFRTLALTWDKQNAISRKSLEKQINTDHQKSQIIEADRAS